MIADAILGKRYAVSLVFIGEARAQKLNVAHRNKTYIPNILSFPYDDRTGEIFICPRVAAREAKQHGYKSVTKYITFLFIHGCLHLKGYDHSDTMDALERKWSKRFDVLPTF